MQTETMELARPPGSARQTRKARLETARPMAQEVGREIRALL